MREIAQEEVRRNYELEMNEFFLNASEEALPEAFQIRFECANDGLKNAKFCFVQNPYRHSAQESIGQHTTQKSRKFCSDLIFMDAFVCRVLTPTQFVLPGTKLVGSKFEERAVKEEETKKTAEISFHFPLDSIVKAFAELDK